VTTLASYMQRNDRRELTAIFVWEFHDGHKLKRIEFYPSDKIIEAQDEIDILIEIPKCPHKRGYVGILVSDKRSASGFQFILDCQFSVATASIVVLIAF